MIATQERIDQPGVVYRVGKRSGSAGLWYDENGQETRLIDALSDGLSKTLPMGPHPIFRSDGFKWISCTRCVEDLMRWFSPNDLVELEARNFDLLAITVTSYRRFHFPGYSHEVFCAEAALDTTALPISVLFGEMAA